MDEPVQRARSGSFGSVADVYERSRPGYPPEAVRWLLYDDPSGDAPAEPRAVIDLAAGTGALTRPLVADRHWVLAVDPSRQMLTRLARRVRAAYPVRGTAEAIPVTDGIADAVVVGQAFHWFDADRALAEIARVLRPGGVLGLVWNRRDETVPWVRHLSRLVDTPQDWDDGWAADLMDTLDYHRQFDGVETTQYRLWQRLDRDGLIHLVSSRSDVATMNPDDRQHLLHQVGILYDMTANSPDGLIMPYTTVCYRVRRV